MCLPPVLARRGARVSAPTWQRGRAVLWQGMRHEWLRRVPQTGWGFATPHRISRLANAVTDQTDPHLWFAQATGVDGNFMRPEAFVTTVRHDALFAQQATVRLQTVDLIAGDPPEAHSALHGEAVFEAPASGVLATALGGLALTTRCDPAQQPPDEPCNSDGMWPFVLRWGLAGPALQRVERGESVRVPVQVTIARGWTPHLGGLPPFEVKPLNRRLSLDVHVLVTAVHAPVGVLEAAPGPSLAGQQALWSRRAMTEAAAAEAPAGDAAAGDAGGASRAGDGRGAERSGEAVGPRVTVLRSAGFELHPPRRGARAKHRHRGRYLRTLHWQAADTDDSARLLAHVHAPRTVVPAQVHTELKTASWRLTGAAVTRRTVVGRLCFNSTAQAPWFSAWRGCDDPGRGPACAEQRLPLS